MRLSSSLLLGSAAACAAGAVASAANAPPSSASLRRVEFANSGVTRANDSVFFADIVPVGKGAVMVYLEADNVSCTNCVWSDGAQYFEPHPYLFKVDPNAPPTPAPPPPVCNLSAAVKGDRPGDDIAQHLLPPGATIDACSKICCDTAQCDSYTYIGNMTLAQGGCPLGSACCWVKSGQPGAWKRSSCVPACPCLARPRPDRLILSVQMHGGQIVRVLCG